MQVSIRELHHSLVSEPGYNGPKEAIYAENNIIISDSEFPSLSPPQLKKHHQDTRSGVVANVTYPPKLHIHHYYHGVIIILKT